MIPRDIKILAWSSFVLAIAAWSAVFMYASWISAQVVASLSQATNARSVYEREMEAERLRALARDTESLRAEMNSLARADVISIADTIEGVGKIAGVQLKIGAVASEPTLQRNTGAGAMLNTVDFIVETDGTFSTVAHVAALLETLPALSSVQSLEFTRVASLTDPKSAKKDNWHLSARVRVFTATDISS